MYLFSSWLPWLAGLMLRQGRINIKTWSQVDLRSSNHPHHQYHIQCWLQPKNNSILECLECFRSPLQEPAARSPSSLSCWLTEYCLCLFSGFDSLFDQQIRLSCSTMTVWREKIAQFHVNSMIRLHIWWGAPLCGSEGWDPQFEYLIYSRCIRLVPSNYPTTAPTRPDPPQMRIIKTDR